MKYNKDSFLTETRILGYFTLILLFGACNQDDKPIADVVYINAKVWTGDSSKPTADSFGVKDSLITFVGEDYQKYKGDKTQVIDLKGRMVIPGFIDNHTHFLSGGYQLASVDLRSATSAEQFITTLDEFLQNSSENRWIQGGDWDHEAWGGELPNRKWIDSISGDNPVFVSRYDGHMALANSVALELAGIDENTPNPEGGEIIRDPVTKKPTGVLKDEAMDLVYQVLPSLEENELDESLDRALNHAYSLGVTQIHDMGSYGGWNDLQTYQRAQENGKLDLRIYSFVPLASWEKMAEFVNENGKGDNLLRWGALKGFVDGSLGSTTAFFYEPYLDEPNTSGLVITDTILLRQQIIKADSSGLHLGVHAIGDRANDWLLDVYKEIKGKENKSVGRYRIEHAQHLSSEAISRFDELGVIPSMQPYHAIDDGKWASKRLDTARLKRTYAFKSLIDNDAKLTFGSDWTVAPLSPILGIYAAVTRRTLDDENPDGWFPEQKLTVEQALTSYTVNNAYSGFFEDKTGMLKEGMFADFVVLSDDLLSISPEKIPEVKVLKTVINGKEVYQRDNI